MTILKKAGAMIFVDDKTSCFSSQKLTNREEIQPKIKTIGMEARADMERLFDNKVHLELWVKVKSGWADDERALRSLGYMDEWI